MCVFLLILGRCYVFLMTVFFKSRQKGGRQINIRKSRKAYRLMFILHHLAQQFQHYFFFFTINDQV